MRKRLVSFILLSFLLLLSLQLPLVAYGSDFKRETIYQIITDRFFDGSSANNNPPQSAGMYDASKTNWRAYWGGDLAGIQQKMSYLAGMGVTAIWISPPVDNLNLIIRDGAGNLLAPYHGYYGRDFKRIEEHFGNANNTWTEFDNLVAAAHQHGIRVIVDFAANHSNQDNAGEFGALYDSGKLLGTIRDDINGLFHHNPNISNWDDRYQVQYYTLFNLTDLNPENATVDAYLKDAAKMFQQHGVDGFRLDTVKHVTWGWEYSLANSIFTNGDSFLIGEWYQGSTSDPLFHDSSKFANRSGISLLDFPLNTAIRNVFAGNANFSEIDKVISEEAAAFTWDEDLVTFIDNHDMSRFQSLSNNNNRLHQALAFIQTARGIPTIYYGTEQYLHNDTEGGNDPYDRPMMQSFDTTTTAYKLVGKLSALRRSNPAIGYGSMTRRWINNDVYVYERKFFGSVVLVAINKNETSAVSVTGFKTSLPGGSYADYLAGMLGGSAIKVSAGSGGENAVTDFTLPAQTAAVWQFTETVGAPEIGSISPTVAQPGVKVTIGGRNFGALKGSVKFGAKPATVSSWSATKIVVTVPSITNSNYNVSVTNSAGRVSNGIQFTTLTARLIPVTFAVNNATPTRVGDHIFLTGNTIELGQWATTWDGAIGPMLAPNYPNWFLCASVPASETIQFKFIKIAADGSVTREAGPNHTFTVPTSGVGFVNVNWQY